MIFPLALGMIINAGQMTNGMDLLHAAEMTPELYDRIQRILCTGQAFTFSELAQKVLKSKNHYTCSDKPCTAPTVCFL